MKRASIVVASSLCVLSLCSFALDQPKRPATQPAPAGQLTLDPGKGVTMTLAAIPAGTFTMGSPEGEKNRLKGEGPQREVTISKPFRMGVYEVTQEQYEAVTGKNPSIVKGPQNPVECVSWDDAVAFCKTVSGKTGKTVSLPTEAQWEYACRAGTETAFGFGDAEADLSDYAWYVANGENKTHPVGQKKPNAWGLYDMHGNVLEWCMDYVSDSYAGAKTTDPQGPPSWTGFAPRRILRGGSWFNFPQICRSAYRYGNSPEIRDGYCGFRVVVLSK